MKNVTNRLRTVVGLAPTSVDDDEMGSSSNLGESLLGSDSAGGSYAPLSTEPKQNERFASQQRDYDPERLNDKDFQERMKKEEEQILKEIRARKIIEEEDHKLAQRLQGEAEDTMMLKVTVPRHLYGGQILNVQIPGMGIKTVQIPLGLKPGDAFMITTTRPGRTDQMARVRVPDGVTTGSTFLVILPNGERINVTVPQGVSPGDEIRIPNVNGSAIPETHTYTDQYILDIMTKEEKEFLQALPAELHQNVIEEKRQSLIDSGAARPVPPSGPGSRIHQQPPSPPNPPNHEGNMNQEMVEIVIPEGIRPGEKFRVIMPDGRATMIEVTSAMRPGMVYNIPANGGTEIPANDGTENANHNNELTEEERKAREEFLNSLPPDIRNEVLRDMAAHENLSPRNNSSTAPAAPKPGHNDDSTTGPKSDQNENVDSQPLIDFADMTGASATTTINEDSNAIYEIQNSLPLEESSTSNDMLDFSSDQFTPTPPVLSSGISMAPAAQIVRPHSTVDQLDELAAPSPALQNPFEQSSASTLAPNHDSAMNQNVPTDAPPAYGSVVPPMNDKNPTLHEMSNQNFANINTSQAEAGAPHDAFADLSIHNQMTESVPPPQQPDTNPMTFPETNPIPPSVDEKTPLEKLRNAKEAFEKGEINQDEFNRIKQEVIRAL